MFTLTIEAFADGGTIPSVFTCEGDNISPALAWAGEPEGTQSFALMMDDPDAPAGTWNHWLLWDIPASVHSAASAISSRPPRSLRDERFRQGRLWRPMSTQGAMVPIATSFGFTRLIHRLWASLKALAERNWNVLSERHRLGIAEYMGRFERI